MFGSIYPTICSISHCWTVPIRTPSLAQWDERVVPGANCVMSCYLTPKTHQTAAKCSRNFSAAGKNLFDRHSHFSSQKVKPFLTFSVAALCHRVMQSQVGVATTAFHRRCMAAHRRPQFSAAWCFFDVCKSVAVHIAAEKSMKNTARCIFLSKSVPFDK